VAVKITPPITIRRKNSTEPALDLAMPAAPGAERNSRANANPKIASQTAHAAPSQSSTSTKKCLHQPVASDANATRSSPRDPICVTIILTATRLVADRSNATRLKVCAPKDTGRQQPDHKSTLTAIGKTAISLPAASRCVRKKYQRRKFKRKTTTGH